MNNNTYELCAMCKNSVVANHPCSNYPLNHAVLELSICNQFESRRETNYEKYFGTLEKAAKYLSISQDCNECFHWGKCHARNDEECMPLLLEWLESEA